MSLRIGSCRRRGYAARVWLCAICMSMWMAAGCGDHREKADRPDESLSESVQAVRAPWPDSIEWPAVEAAVSYRVRAWAGTRLLFEELPRGTELTLSPSMKRAMAPFDTLSVVIRSFDAEEHEVGLQRRLEWVR